MLCLYSALSYFFAGSAGPAVREGAFRWAPGFGGGPFGGAGAIAAAGEGAGSGAAAGPPPPLFFNFVIASCACCSSLCR